MSIELSHKEARRFLATYHFTQTDLPGVFTRLGTVQYDPLNPVGRNPDLVLQARVPGYRVDDWQHAAYSQRLIYDAWDKQACLIPVSDWAMRAMTRQHFRPYHDREILQADAGTATAILAAIDKQGPLSSLEFEGRDRTRFADQNSWYGATRIKRVLRSMWACGLLLTHHRKHGRHYYERPERVIPSQHYAISELGAEEYHRWIIARRYQAVGLLRPTAEACIWSACGDAAVRKRTLAELVEAGTLTAVRVGPKGQPYHMPSHALPLLNAPLPETRVIFLGPLDSILWDRKATQTIFAFDYIWEVYKPVAQRRWGYYVLPVFYKDRFIARVDCRLVGKTWTIARWWWEEDSTQDSTLLDDLRTAASDFLYYLQADAIHLEEGIVDKFVQEAFAV